MKRERCLNERIASALRQAEGGTAMEGICRKVGVSEAMFTRCKKQFAGMGTVEIWRLQQLEEEKAKLKRLVAGLEPGRDHAAGWSRKRMLKPGAFGVRGWACCKAPGRSASEGPVRPWGSGVPRSTTAFGAIPR